MDPVTTYSWVDFNLLRDMSAASDPLASPNSATVASAVWSDELRAPRPKEAQSSDCPEQVYGL